MCSEWYHKMSSMSLVMSASVLQMSDNITKCPLHIHVFVVSLSVDYVSDSLTKCPPNV